MRLLGVESLTAGGLGGPFPEGQCYGTDRRLAVDQRRACPLQGFHVGRILSTPASGTLAQGPLPVSPQGIFIFFLVKYKPLKYNNTYTYPTWGYGIGWLMALSSMLCIPLWVFIKLWKTEGTLPEVRREGGVHRA